MIRKTSILVKASGLIAPLALKLATVTANSTCYFYSYQPKVPKKLKKND